MMMLLWAWGRSRLSLGKIQKRWQKWYNLSDMFPCLDEELVFLLCPVFKSGGVGFFLVVFWICRAHESGFTGTQQV